MKLIEGLIQDIPDEKKAKKVAYKIFIIITLAIFTVEMLIMIVLSFQSEIFPYTLVIFDSLILTVVISPLLYLFLVRPLLINISKRTADQGNMKKINEKLNIESQRLFKVLDGLPASVHLLDRDHKIRFANNYFRENFGEIEEQPCYKLLQGRNEPCLVCDTFEVFDQHTLEEHEILRKNGRIYNVYNYPFVDMDGDKLVLQLAIDITERKKAENELLQRERQLKLVLSSMSDTLYTIDKNESITAIYGEGLKNAGIRTDNLIGKKISNLFEPQRLSEFREAFQKVLKGESTLLSWETQLPTGNLYFQNALSPVFDQQGNVTHITGIAHNVTRQKMLDKRLIETEKLMTVGRMSAMISHEFRNSLTSVRMILELLGESQDIKVSDKRSLDVALNSVAGMEDIVSQLLAFSRPAETTFDLCDLKEIIKDSLKLTGPQLHKYNIVLNKSLGERPVFINVDCSKLKETFVNILINAVQAISENSTTISKREITITLSQLTLKSPVWNQAVCKHDGDTLPDEIVWEEKFDNTLPAGTGVLAVTFADTGPGIKAEHLSNIFDSFFTTRKEGTGLGLAVVKRTVAEHNGVITISSKIDVGTTISIYLKYGQEGDE